MDKYVQEGNSFRGTANMFDASWAFSQMQESHLHSLQESGCFCVKTTVQSISTRRSVVSQHPFRWPFRPAIPREGVTIPVQEARTATRCVQEPFFGLGNSGKHPGRPPTVKQPMNEYTHSVDCFVQHSQKFDNQITCISVSPIVSTCDDPLMTLRFGSIWQFWTDWTVLVDAL